MSEWLKDKFGRQYRIDEMGRIEFRPKLQTTNGEIYADQLPSANRLREEEEKRLQAQRQAERANYTERVCPYKRSRATVHTQCNKDCAFYNCGCLLSQGEPIPNTINRICPIAGGYCNSACAMYDNGCRIIF